MIKFKLGDKVRVKPTLKQELGNSFRSDVGIVINIEDYTDKQHCRVSFGNSTFDYDDFGAWRLSLVERGCENNVHFG